MKCMSCNTDMARHEGEYHYAECGLDNVYLLGVDWWRCPSCGNEAAAIPEMEQLHRLIARMLVRREYPLTGREMKFVRKTIRLPAAEFARKIRKNKKTISFWENEKTSIPMSADYSLRLFALPSLFDGGEVQEFIRETIGRIDARVQRGERAVAPVSAEFKPRRWRLAA